MSELIETVKQMYAAFGRGDINTLVANMTDDVSWEFEATPEFSWAGIRRTPREAVGFFTGIAAEHENPVLEMTDFFSAPDAVAAFGRYKARQ